MPKASTGTHESEFARGHAVKINNQSLTNGLLSATIILALFVVGRDFFVPLMFALLLWAILNAGVNFMVRHGLPSWAAWQIAAATIVIAIVFVGLVVADQAQALIAEAPEYAKRLQTMWNTNPFHTLLPAVNFHALTANDGVKSILGTAAASVGSTLMDLVLILIYVGFLLAEQGHIPEKIARLQKNHTEAEGEEVVRAIGHQVETYLGVCTLASLLMGIATYIILLLFGVDFAAFWALAMFIFCYIPTVGAVGVVLPALMALAQFGTLGLPLLIAVVLFSVHFFLASVLETVLLGRTLDLSPFAIIVSLTFWGLVWGVGGLFLAVPLTGAFAIICRHVEGLEWIAEILAGDHTVRKSRARLRLRFGTR